MDLSAGISRALTGKVIHLFASGPAVLAAAGSSSLSLVGPSLCLFVRFFVLVYAALVLVVLSCFPSWLFFALICRYFLFLYFCSGAAILSIPTTLMLLELGYELRDLNW